MDLWPDADERAEIGRLADAGLTALALVFLGLLLAELVYAPGGALGRWVELAGWLIWVVFAADFVMRLALAPSKRGYLRRNWPAALAVVLPAFRVVRAFRAVRAVRSLRLVRLLTGTSRGARALRRVAGFGGAGYVALLTLVVWLLAAAGIAWLERGQPRATIDGFGAGLWWAATTIIQQGSESHPTTVEGRVLGVLVMIYSLAISGYITALLAALLLGRRDQATRDENAALREELRRLRGTRE